MATTRTGGGVSFSLAIVAMPGALASAIYGIADAINLANFFHVLEGGRESIDLRILSPNGRNVDAFGGAEIACTGSVLDIAVSDAVVVTPLVGDIDGLLDDAKSVVEWLAFQAEAGVTVSGVCTGTVLLAESGVLNGLVATTNPSLLGLFEERYPEVEIDPTLKLADAGRIITAGATTSSYDLVIELIGRYLGPSAAVRTAAELLTDPVPQSQQPYGLARPRRGHADRAIQELQGLIEREFARPLEVDELARKAGMSARSLARHFRAATGESVQEYVRNTRVEEAMRRLAASDDSVEEIAAACGYDDARSFRRAFGKRTGVSPSIYRARFNYARRSWPQRS